jgi:hypothetical protein
VPPLDPRFLLNKRCRSPCLPASLRLADPRTAAATKQRRARSTPKQKKIGGDESVDTASRLFFRTFQKAGQRHSPPPKHAAASQDSPIEASVVRVQRGRQKYRRIETRHRPTVILTIVGETTTERCQNCTAKLALQTASAVGSQQCVCREVDRW